jgi:hypothetical protein
MFYYNSKTINCRKKILLIKEEICVFYVTTFSNIKQNCIVSQGQQLMRLYSWFLLSSIYLISDMFDGIPTSTRICVNLLSLTFRVRSLNYLRMNSAVINLRSVFNIAKVLIFGCVQTIAAVLILVFVQNLEPFRIGPSRLMLQHDILCIPSWPIEKDL